MDDKVGVGIPGRKNQREQGPGSKKDEMSLGLAGSRGSWESLLVNIRASWDQAEAGHKAPALPWG